MASTTDTSARFVQDESVAASAVVAVITAEELEAAQRDPRVQSFLEDADAYLVAFEQQGRNR